MFDYETIPPGYYDTVFHRAHGAQSKWHHLKFARVTQEIAGRSRHLDIGCGPGTFIGQLPADATAVGIDLSARQIEYARARYGSESRAFYNCTMDRLPAHLDGFDAITAVELIEHLSPEEVKVALESAVERLVPGGKLVLTTPNFGGVWPLVEALLNRAATVTYEMQHTNKFTRSSLAVLLTMLGLREVRVATYLGVAPFIASFGWNTADQVSKWEQRFLEPRSGLLLIGTGTKAYR
jgi:2-polyprenyl-3-methyl-5-hydroxy-6-metoxy-1,4-benzoquinol methylase